MLRHKTGAARLFKAGAIAGLILMSGCKTTMVGGCSAYAEARLDMPRLGVDDLSYWVADLDDRMTGVCT